MPEITRQRQEKPEQGIKPVPSLCHSLPLSPGSAQTLLSWSPNTNTPMTSPQDYRMWAGRLRSTSWRWMSGGPHGSCLQKRRSCEQPRWRARSLAKSLKQEHFGYSRTWERQFYFCVGNCCGLLAMASQEVATRWMGWAPVRQVERRGTTAFLLPSCPTSFSPMWAPQPLIVRLSPAPAVVPQHSWPQA